MSTKLYTIPLLKLRWHRFVTQQDPIVPIFKCIPSRELSSSLMLDVTTWCLFINSIGCTIQLINSTDRSCCIVHSNNIAMPLPIAVSFRTLRTIIIWLFLWSRFLQKAFSIAVWIDQKWLHSCPIYITSSRGRAKPCYDIAAEGSAIVKIMAESKLCKFQLSSMMENNSRVFILSPHFVVCNHTDRPVNIWAFCKLQRVKQTFKMPSETDHIGMYTIPCQNAQKR